MSVIPLFPENVAPDDVPEPAIDPRQLDLFDDHDTRNLEFAAEGLAPPDVTLDDLLDALSATGLRVFVVDETGFHAVEPKKPSDLV